MGLLEENGEEGEIERREFGGFAISAVSLSPLITISAQKCLPAPQKPVSVHGSRAGEWKYGLGTYGHISSVSGIER